MAVVTLDLGYECGWISVLAVSSVTSSAKWEERYIEASFTKDRGHLAQAAPQTSFSLWGTSQPFTGTTGNRV